jgi:FixJ family two-component response regulator
MSVDANDAPEVRRAAWSQGTISVSSRGIVHSERQLNSYPVPFMSAEPEPVCIVDDDASVRNSTVQLLDSDGLRAQSFEDAQGFLAYARSHPVHLALLDVWMPKTSGLEVQGQLRVVSPKTKVIVITAREIPAIRAAALEVGAFAFLTKPFDDEAFLSLVHQALGLAA